MRLIRRVMKYGLILTVVLLIGGGAVFMSTMGGLFKAFDAGMATAQQPITPGAQTSDAISEGDALGVISGMLGMALAPADGETPGDGGILVKMLDSEALQAGVQKLVGSGKLRRAAAFLVDDPELEAMLAAAEPQSTLEALALDPRVQDALYALITSPEAQAALTQFATDPNLQRQVLAQVEDPMLNALVTQTLQDPTTQAALQEFAQDPAMQAEMMRALTAGLAGMSPDSVTLDALAPSTGLDPALIAQIMPALLETASLVSQATPMPVWTPFMAPTATPRPAPTVATAGIYAITVNDYIRIHAGMHLDEIEEVLGGPGARVSTQTVGGVAQPTYVWLNVDGSYVSVTMRGDLALSITQQGLPISYD